MNDNRRTRPAAAFTLVEILAVIVIIGLLAALLFPVLTSTKGNARRVVCVSNLRQLGAAVTLYVQDSDGVFLPTAQKSEKTIFWFDLLQPYLKDKKIIECPEDTTESFVKYGRSSYGYNAHLGGVAFPQSNSAKLDISQKDTAQVIRPASTVLMTDSGTIPLQGTTPNHWPAVIPCPQEIGDSAVMSNHEEKEDVTPIQNGLLPAPRARHSGKTNVLWADSHVTTQAISAFYVSPGVTAPGETVPGYSPCLRPEKGCP
ncbi:MAG: prepilin-type N-terminal cleavage/methylation domain-containing protein [Armatimonadota bacterium]